MEFALGEENREFTLATDGENPSSLSANGEIPVTVRPGDDVVGDGVPAPTIVKIDVEGAEVNVLRGLSDTLKRDKCRLVCIEVHEDHLDQFDTSRMELISMLEAAGFETSELDRRNEKNWHLLARN